MRRTLVLPSALIIVLTIVGCTGDDGASLVRSKCSTCHSVDWVTSASADTRADWEGNITRMEAKGLTLTDEERATVLDYLNTEYGAE